MSQHLTPEAQARYQKLKDESLRLFHGNFQGATEWMTSHIIKPLGKTIAQCVDSDRDTEKALGEIARIRASSAG